MGIVSDAAQSPGDVMARLRALERRLDELSTARRLESSAIGEGGLRITGGTLRVTNPDGQEIVYLGPREVGGEDSHGWTLRRDDGGAAFTLQGDAGNQYFAFWDKAGNIIVSSDAESREGLARPWIPLSNPEPTGIGHWPGTSDSSWAALARCYPYLQHPRLAAVVSTAADDGTAGDVRITIDDKQVGPQVKAGDLLQFTAAIPGGLYEFGKGITLQVEGRRTSGSGEVRAITRRLYGAQS